MADVWVCNSSPLILLHRIGHLRLLSKLCNSIVIPQCVIEEVLPYEDDMTEWKAFLGFPNVSKWMLPLNWLEKVSIPTKAIKIP